MKFQHVPAPWPEWEPDPQPALRAGFEALGFRVLGAAVRVLPTDGQVARLGAGYAAGDREQFLEWAGRPYQVLAAPDASAFIRLGWFWSGRYAEVLSVLPDRRLITTSTDWGVDPAWPRQTRRWYTATTDRWSEQRLWLSTSFSSRVVDGSAGDIWASHRSHVAEVLGEGSGPTGHERLADAIAVFDAVQACRIRVGRRAGRLAKLAGLLVSFALVISVTLMFRPEFPASLVLIAVGWGVWVVVQKHTWLRARHWRWMHQRLRAPVPQSRAQADPEVE